MTIGVLVMKNIKKFLSKNRKKTNNDVVVKQYQPTNEKEMKLWKKIEEVMENGNNKSLKRTKKKEDDENQLKKTKII